MAYTLPNTGIVRPWDHHPKKRYVHKRIVLTVGGSGKGGGATATASDTIDCPPGRIVSVRYGAPAAIGMAGAALTGGTLLLKAETTAGVTVFTDATLNSVPTVWSPVGTTSKDEGNAATAATDAFSGGFPIRGGIFASISGGTDTEICVVDVIVRLTTYVKLDLVSQSGADGTGAVTRFVDLGGPGVLSAIALDYQNMPATTDILIKCDSTDGMTLFTLTSANTDLAPSLLGRPGADEGNAATAATDGTECGNAFQQGLFVDIAEADIFTGGNEHLIMELWVDD